MRAFISLNPDKESKNFVESIQREIRFTLLSEETKIRWERPHQFHLTLRFIGEINEDITAKIIHDFETINNLGEISLRAEEFTAFPTLSKPRTLILKLSDKENKSILLSDKINTILESYGLPAEKKFTPHITLGRVRANERINLMNIKPQIFKKTFLFREFFLMKSVLTKQGAVHDIVKCFELK